MFDNVTGNLLQVFRLKAALEINHNRSIILANNYQLIKSLRELSLYPYSEPIPLSITLTL